MMNRQPIPSLESRIAACLTNDADVVAQLRPPGIVARRATGHGRS